MQTLLGVTLILNLVTLFLMVGTYRALGDVERHLLDLHDDLDKVADQVTAIRIESTKAQSFSADKGTFNG